MATTAWTNGGGDGLASNPANWSSGLPGRWNTPFFDLTERVEMKWDLRSYDPDRYEWVGDPYNLVCEYVVAVCVSGTPWVPAWVVERVVESGVEQRIDAQTLPAPPPGVDYVGTPVALDGRDADKAAADLGWTWWFVQDDFIFQQDDADRFWVGGGGNWSDNTNHWSASSGGGAGASKPAAGDVVYVDNGSDSGGAPFQITLDESTASSLAGFSIDCTDATCTVACGAFNVDNASGAFTQANGIVTYTTGVLTCTDYILSGGAHGSNTSWELICDSFSISSGTFNAPDAGSGNGLAINGVGNAWNQSGGTFNNDSGFVLFQSAGTSSLESNATDFYDVIIISGTTLATASYNVTVSDILYCGVDGDTGNVSVTGGTKSIGSTLYIESGGAFGTAATNYTLDVGGNILDPTDDSPFSGTLIAPNASGTFTFSGATWDNSNGTFTHSSGVVTFDRAGTTSLGDDSTSFYGISVADGATLALLTWALTAAGAVTVGGGASGAITTSTGVKRVDGALTINAGASFGTAATAYTLDLNGDINASAGTLQAPNNLGAFTFSGANWNTPTTFTHNDGKVLMDLAGTTTFGNDGLQFAELEVSDGCTLALSTRSLTCWYIYVGGGASGVVTLTASTTVQFSSAAGIGTEFRAGSTFGVADTAYTLNWDATVCSVDPTATFYCPNAAGSFLFGGPNFKNLNSTPGTGTITFDRAGTTTMQESQTSGINNAVISDGTTFASATYSITIGGTLVVGGGASGAFTTSTGTKRVDGALTINAGASFGTAATAYTLDLNGNLATSTGTLIAPNASGTFTFSGATWNTPTTFTHSSGKVTFDLAGTTTLGNASTQFYAITINAGATLDTSAASNYALTANTTGDVNCVAVIATGVLNLNGSAVGLGTDSTWWGISSAGTVACGSATISSGPVNIGDASSWTATSGQHTISSAYNQATADALNISATATFNNGSGLFTFNFAGTQTINNANAINPYDISVTAGGTTVKLEANLTIARNLTVTAGAFSTLDTDGATSRNLVVSGATSITGTLSLNASSTCTFAAITINDGGQLANMTATTHATGTLTVGGGASGSLSFTSGAGHFHQVGATTINAGATLGTAATHFELFFNGDLNVSAGELIAPNVVGHLLFYDGHTWNTPTTFTHSSSDITFLGSGTITIGNNSTAFYDVQIANFATVDSQTYDFTCNSMDIGGGVSGSFITSTGTKTINGTLNIGTGANFGTAATAYTLDLNGDLLTSAGTLIAPNASTFTFSGATWNTPTTFTHSSGAVIFDAAGTTTLGNDSIQFYKIRTNSGATLNTSAAGNYALTCDCGSSFYAVDNRGSLNCNASACTFSNIQLYDPSGTWTASSATTYINGTAATAMNLQNNATFSHNNGTVIFTGTGSTYGIVINKSATFYDFEANGSGTLLLNTSNVAYTFTFNTFTLTTGAVSTYKTVNATMTVTGATSVTGTLTCNGSTVALSSLTTAATGVVNGNTAAISLTGAWDTSAAVGCWVCGTSTVTFQAGGAQTVTAAAHNFYNVSTATASTAVTQGSAITTATNATFTIAASTSWNTSAANNYAMTVNYTTSVFGALTCNASTISLASGVTGAYGLTVQPSATFTGGSGTHTIGSINSDTTNNILTLSSGNTTFNAARASNKVTLAINSTTTFSHSNGTVIFTYAGQQLLYRGGNAALNMFFTLQINNASCVLQWFNAAGCNLTISNTFTITAGQFNTSETVTGTSRNLTVTGATSVTGTLTCNGSTVLLRSGAAGATAVSVTGGTMNCNSANITAGNVYVDATGTFNGNTASITLNGTDAASYGWSHTAGATYNMGTSSVTSTASHLINPTFWNYDVNVPGGTVTLAEALVVQNAFSITDGELDTDAANNYAVTIGSGGGVGTTVINPATVSSTFTPNASTVQLNGTTTISNNGALPGLFGGATDYTLDMNANLLASTGTLSAPTCATGTFTYSGATWLTPTTFTHNAGTVTLDANVTLGNASIQFNAVTVAATYQFSTASFAMACAGMLTLSATTTSTLVNSAVVLYGMTALATATQLTLGATCTADIGAGGWNSSNITGVVHTAGAVMTFTASCTWTTGARQHVAYDVTIDAGVTTTTPDPGGLGYSVRVKNVLTINGGMTGTGADPHVTVGWATTTSATPLVLGGTFTGFGALTSVEYQNDCDYNVASTALYPELDIWAANTATANRTATALGDITCTLLEIQCPVLAYTAILDMAGFQVTSSANTYVGNIAGTRLGAINSTGGIIEVQGDLYVTMSGSYLNMSATTQLYTAGNATYVAGSTLAASTGFTWYCYGATIYTDNNVAPLRWADIEVDPACSLTCATHIASDQATTINGTFTGGAADNDMNGVIMNAGGAWIATSAVTYIFSNITINGGAFTHSSGEINFDDADLLPAIYTWTTGGVTYYDIVFNITVSTKVHEVVGTLTIANDFAMNTSQSELDLQAETMNLAGDFTVVDGTFSYDPAAILNFNGGALQTITVPAGDFNVPNVTVAAGASVITTYRLRVVGVKTGVTVTFGPPVASRFVVNDDMTIDPAGTFTHAPEFAAGGGGWQWWM